MIPERALWAAVLFQALHDLMGICLRTRRLDAPRLQYEAREWFVSPTREVGSFLWIAALLGLDSSAVRRRVAELGRLQISPAVQVLRPPMTPAIKEEGHRGESQWIKLPRAPRSLAPGLPGPERLRLPATAL